MASLVQHCDISIADALGILHQAQNKYTTRLERVDCQSKSWSLGHYKLIGGGLDVVVMAQSHLDNHSWMG